jgi:hypothetical protein
MAMRKRIATNEIGGRSRSPILMASQVELQTTQSVSHAAGTPHPALGRKLFGSDTFVVFTRAEHRALVAIRKDRSSQVRRWVHHRLTVPELQERVPTIMRRFFPLLLCLSLSIFTVARATKLAHSATLDTRTTRKPPVEQKADAKTLFKHANTEDETNPSDNDGIDNPSGNKGEDVDGDDDNDAVDNENPGDDDGADDDGGDDDNGGDQGK